MESLAWDSQNVVSGHWILGRVLFLIHRLQVALFLCLRDLSRGCCGIFTRRLFIIIDWIAKASQA